MNRRQKYPNTKTFRFFNANPKGRLTCDCVVRAICTATGTDYNKVVMDLARIQCDTGYDASGNQGIDILLKEYGWKKQKQPRKANGKKYTGKEFCQVIQRWLPNTDTYGNEWDDGIVISPSIVANIGGGHIVAIVDGYVKDTWDSTDGSIGNYWIRQ